MQNFLLKRALLGCPPKRKILLHRSNKAMDLAALICQADSSVVQSTQSNSGKPLQTQLGSCSFKDCTYNFPETYTDVPKLSKRQLTLSDPGRWVSTRRAGALLDVVGPVPTASAEGVCLVVPLTCKVQAFLTTVPLYLRARAGVSLPSQSPTQYGFEIPQSPAHYEVKP